MSKVYQFVSREQVAAEARSWVVRLDSDLPLSKEEKRAFEAWLAHSQMHREEFERVSSLWQLGDVLKQLAILPEKRPGRRLLPRLSRLFPTQWGPRLVALSVVLALGGYVGFQIHGNNSGESYQNVYVTDIGEISRTVLRDGSVLHINTNTRVKVDYRPDYRTVHLLQGEAYFDVESDTERPFVVYARNSIVEAVGTAFSVSTDRDSTSVVVTEGRVDLALGAATTDPKAVQNDRRKATRKVASLGENEIASIDDLSLERASQGDDPARFVQYSSATEAIIRNQLAWREGYISLAGEPLSYLVGQLGRYTRQTIKIANPALENMRIGGGFRLDDIDGLFQVLESDFGITVTRVNDELILLDSPDT